MFVPHASEIWPNRMVQTTRNFEIFDKKKKKKKNRFLKTMHSWLNVDAILEDVSIAETIV